MSKRKSTIIFRHRKGKGGSVSAEAEQKKIEPVKAKKALQSVVDQQKEG